MQPIIVKGNAAVWLGQHHVEHYGAAQLIAAIAAGEQHISMPMFAKPGLDMATGARPWLQIGEAEIVLTMMPPDTIAAEELRTLQRSLDAMRAEHQMAQNALLDRISKLQALTFEHA